MLNKKIFCAVNLAKYTLGNYNRNTRTRCETCSKLTLKTPERRSGVFIVNFKYISHLVLVFLLLTLSRLMPTETGVRRIEIRDITCDNMDLKL